MTDDVTKLGWYELVNLLEVDHCVWVWSWPSLSDFPTVTWLITLSHQSHFSYICKLLLYFVSKATVITFEAICCYIWVQSLHLKPIITLMASTTGHFVSFSKFHILSHFKTPIIVRNVGLKKQKTKSVKICPVLCFYDTCNYLFVIALWTFITILLIFISK